MGLQYYIHQDDNHNITNHMCKQAFRVLKIGAKVSKASKNSGTTPDWSYHRKSENQIAFRVH